MLAKERGAWRTDDNRPSYSAPGFLKPAEPDRVQPVAPDGPSPLALEETLDVLSDPEAMRGLQEAEVARRVGWLGRTDQGRGARPLVS